jgi:hypothetical protein
MSTAGRDVLRPETAPAADPQLTREGIELFGRDRLGEGRRGVTTRRPHDVSAVARVGGVDEKVKVQIRRRGHRRDPGAWATLTPGAPR